MARIQKFQDVRNWAQKKGIYDFGSVPVQSMKMMEEMGEFCDAYLKQDKEQMIDALGDMQVVLINLAKLSGVRLEDALDTAYNVIKDRNGNMVNGTFVKMEEKTILGEVHELKFIPTTTCAKCGIDFQGAHGYVCQNTDCPMGMAGPAANTVNGIKVCYGCGEMLNEDGKCDIPTCDFDKKNKQ